jgi:hypothetical protein
MEVVMDNKEDNMMKKTSTNYIVPVLSFFVYWFFGMQTAITSVAGYMALRYSDRQSWTKFALMFNFWLFGFWNSIFSLIQCAFFMAILNYSKIVQAMKTFKQFVKTVEENEKMKKSLKMEISEKTTNSDYYINIFLTTLNYFKAKYNFVQLIWINLKNKLTELCIQFNLAYYFWFFNSCIGFGVSTVRYLIEKLPYIGIYLSIFFSKIETHINISDTKKIEILVETEEDSLESFMKNGSFSTDMLKNLRTPSDIWCKEPTEDQIKGLQNMMGDIAKLQNMMGTLDTNMDFMNKEPTKDQMIEFEKMMKDFSKIQGSESNIFMQPTRVARKKRHFK